MNEKEKRQNERPSLEMGINRVVLEESGFHAAEISRLHRKNAIEDGTLPAAKNEATIGIPVDEGIL